MEINFSVSRRLIPVSERKLGPKIETSVAEQKFTSSCQLSPQHNIALDLLSLISCPHSAGEGALSLHKVTVLRINN